MLALVLWGTAACGHAPGAGTSEPAAPAEDHFYVAVVNHCEIEQAVCVSLQEPGEDTVARSIGPEETAIQRLRPDERVWRKSHGQWRPAGWFSDAGPDGGEGRVELHCGI